MADTLHPSGVFPIDPSTRLSQWGGAAQAARQDPEPAQRRPTVVGLYRLLQTAASIVAPALLCSTARAQLTWNQYVVYSPGTRASFGLAYDASRNCAVFFGGQGYLSNFGGGFNDQNDTAEWLGDHWVPRNPASSPPRMSGHAMVYDLHRGVTVLFGGQGSQRFSDTWEYDGTTWIARNPPTRPTARTAHAMAYDAARRRTVLFGGNDGNGSLGDTWEWNGTDWRLRTPVVGPSPRAGHAMAYDSMRSRVVLFGGTTNIADTWEWDGTAWTQVAPPVAPSPRTDTAMAFLPSRHRVVLFGGASAQGMKGDTWEWDGSTWTERPCPVNPPRRYAHAMVALDSARLLCYGGQGASGSIVVPIGDTWGCSPTGVATFTMFGTGCPGSAGLPGLSAGSVPRLGTRFVLRTAPCPPGAPGLMFALGLSRTQWGLFPLPLGLGAIGLPGCSLYVSAEVPPVAMVSTASGQADHAIDIPNDPQQVGFEFFSQAFLFDPQANASGWICTNGGHSILGF